VADLSDRLAQLEQSLASFGDSDAVPAEVGDVFDALLVEAKREKPGDAVVAAIDPLGKTFEGSEFADIDVRSLRALIQQLCAALD
jgi:hypothetical protein